MMCESSQSQGNLPDADTTPQVQIGGGKHGTVTLDTTSGIVQKKLRVKDSAKASSLVQREFDRLNGFSAALAGEPFISCPRPIGVDPQRGIVEMTYCSGTRVDQLLMSGDSCIDDHLKHIAEQIAVAASRYIRKFNEPCYSLSTNNLIYDDSTRILHVIDFTSPREYPGIDPQEFPHEITAGCFLGVTTYHTVRVRPATWKDRRYWKRQKRLSTGVLQNLDAERPLTSSLIHEVSGIVYRRFARNGRPLRRLWYGTVGQALFNRRRDAVISNALTNVGPTTNDVLVSEDQ